MTDGPKGASRPERERAGPADGQASTPPPRAGFRSHADEIAYLTGRGTPPASDSPAFLALDEVKLLLADLERGIQADRETIRAKLRRIERLLANLT